MPKSAIGACWVAGGNAYNQLAVLAVQSSDSLAAVYFHLRSLAVAKPFGVAKDNLVILFEQNRQRYQHLVQAQVVTYQLTMFRACLTSAPF